MTYDIANTLSMASSPMAAPMSMGSTKKVVVVGDGFVGKTSLVSKITEGKFINNYHATVGGTCTHEMCTCV